MNSKITSNLHSCPRDERKTVVAPSKQSLDLIKQFARSYYVEKEIPVSIAGICIN